jgi:hypothetical protein
MKKLKIDNPTKTILAILTAIVMLLSIAVPTMAFRSGLSPAGANYVVLEGTAGSDAYSSMQYSYMVNQWAVQNGLQFANQSYPNDTYYNASKSLRVGLTEYGEMATPASAGIAYGANNNDWNLTESWASSNPAIPPQLEIQGWTFYLNYTRQGVMRAVEAWSMYSNTSVTEGARAAYSWYGNYNPADTGASLTVGTLKPTGIEVLYDSARLAVVRTGTIIHDQFYNEDVAEVFVTINFYKDMKYAIVNYDVKILLEPKILDLISDFAFSNRYELDIAANFNPSNAAFVHYYHNSNSTYYQYPVTGASTYDVLQAYDVGYHNIFFAGYWPNTTEYTVYNQLLPNPPGNSVDNLPYGTAVPDLPGPSASPKEPSTPWVIAQWRYNNTLYPNLDTWLAKGANREMRFTAVVGMTDFNADPHGAKDANDTTYNVNQLDTEVLYTLNSVFNPTDLNSLRTTSATAYPFMYTALGETSATTDSAGASVLGSVYGANVTALPLFDMNASGGGIPVGLDPYGGTYYQSFSNSGLGVGSDMTTYKRGGLLDFVPNANEEVETGNTFPPQPIAGGWDTTDNDTWYPSINPLTQAWAYPPFTTSSNTIAMGTAITYNPNGILSLGGGKANQITRYFNDFGIAIDREGTSGTYYAKVDGGTVTGTAPTSDATMRTLDFFPVSTWNVATTTFGYTAGYAVISLAHDVNGTRGLTVYGWNGQDTMWAAAWASQYIFGNTTSSSAGLPTGTVAVILNITYGGPNNEPTAFTVVKALGTITEFGTNAFVTFSGAHPYDLNAALTWGGLVSPSALPIVGPVHVWWEQKLPTTSTAKVDFN